LLAFACYSAQRHFYFRFNTTKDCNKNSLCKWAYYCLQGGGGGGFYTNGRSSVQFGGTTGIGGEGGYSFIEGTQRNILMTGTGDGG
jgi:hypothetical protein